MELPILTMSDLEDELESVDFHGKLREIRASLSNEKNPRRQMEAATLLAKMTLSMSQERYQDRLSFPKMLSTLARSFSEHQNPDLRVEAARVLCNLTSGDVLRHYMWERIVWEHFDHTSTLETLAASVSDKQTTHFQAKATFARLLANVTCCKCWVNPHLWVGRRRCIHSKFCEELLGVPGFLQDLANSLSKHENPELQVEAARVFSNMSGLLSEFCEELLGVPGFLQDLANSLSKHDNPKLQVEAARVFSNMSGLLSDDSRENVFRFLVSSGTFDTLVIILSDEQNPRLQVEAATLLATRIRYKKYQVRQFLGLIQKTCWFSEVLQELENSLSKRESSDLQVQAVRVFSNISGLLPRSIREAFFRFLLERDVLASLMSMLRNKENLRLQAEAARLLAIMTSDNDDLCWKVLQSPEVKEYLANFLSNPENPDLQVEIVRVFSNMSPSVSEDFFQFLVDSGTLGTIVASLSDKKNARHQAGAARLLAIMTSHNDDLCCKFLRFPGVKEYMANFLSNPDNPDLQVELVMVFSNMSSSRSGFKEFFQFLVDSGTLDMMMASLLDERNLRLQAEAVRLLAKMTRHKDVQLRVYQKILQFSGVKEKLANLLSKDEDPGLQMEAATVFSNMSGLVDENICKALFHFLGDKVFVAFLSSTQNLRLQEDAARLLANITRWNNYKSLFIQDILASNLRGILKTLARRALENDKVSSGLWLEVATLLSFVTCSESKENYFCSEILRFPQIMKKLAKSLWNHEARGEQQALQLEAARVFRNMSGLSDDGSRLKVFKLMASNREAMLKTLAALLSNGDNPGLRLEAARLLFYVTGSNDRDYELCRDILRSPGITINLPSLLSKHGDLDLQVETVRVLSNMLGLPDAEDRRKLLITSDLLSLLVALVTDGQDLRLQVEATRLLADVTHWRNYELCSQILRVSGTMERLTWLLNHEYADLGVEAARALSNMFESSDYASGGKFPNPRARGMLDTVVTSLTNEKRPHLQVEAAKLLASIASSKNQELYSKDLWFPGIIERLANSLAQDRNLDLQLEAAKVLCDMAGIPDDEFHEKLLHFVVFDHSGMMDTMVDLLSNERNPGLQAETARLLANITRWKNHDVCSKILRFPGMIQKLTSSLLRHENPVLQMEAATVFCNLSGLLDDGRGVDRFNCQGVLDILKSSLFQGEDGHLEVETVKLLAQISRSSHYEFCIKMFWFPGVMEKLADSFSNHQNSELQVEAAKVFNNMSRLPDNECLRKLFNLRGVLDTLVVSLSDERHCSLQAEVVRLIANIARSRNYELCINILRFPGIMEKLVALLSKHENSDLQMEVTAVFCNMSGMPDDEFRGELLNIPSLLDTLVASLLGKQSSSIQVQAARLLANITSSKSSKLCSEVLRFPGMMEALESSLSENQQADLQMEAARLLCNTSGFLDGESFKKKSGLLSQSDHPLLRLEATKAFACLSGWTTEALHLKLRSHYTARMEMMERSLSRCQGFDRWFEAARLLRSLSALKDDVMRGKIVYFNNSKVLEKLLGVLSLDPNPDLQAEVIGVFSNLLNFPDGGPQKQGGERVIQKLVTWLSQKQNPDLQLSITRMLASLSASEDASFWRRILSFGVLDSLASALSWTGYPSLQVNAATVFANVSALDDDLLSEEILKSPGMLEKLTGLLSENGNPLLQVAGARTLANFTSTKADTIQARLIHFPGLMIKVAISFIQKGYRLVQVEAARAFANLMYMKGAMLHQRDIRIRDLLKSLARSSTQNLKSHPQGQGAGETQDPSCTEDDAVGGRKFVRSASSGEICALEVEAARVLINWAISEDDTFMGGQVLCSDRLMVWVGAESQASGSNRRLKLNELTPQLRLDIQSLGLTTWDRQYNPQEIFGLYNMRADQKGIDFMFFHARGMANIFGVGLHPGIVSVVHDPELQIKVEEIESKRWKGAWVNSYGGSFKPILFHISEESSSGSDNHDALAEKGVVEISTLGDVASPTGFGLLYKRWIEDFIRFLQHGHGFRNDDGVGSGVGARNDENGGSENGGRRVTEVDHGVDQGGGISNAQGVDSGNNQGGDTGNQHSDGSEYNEGDGRESPQANGSDNCQGESRDVEGGYAGNGQVGDSGKGQGGNGDSGKGQGGNGDSGKGQGGNGDSGKGQGGNGDSGKGQGGSGEGGDPGNDDGNDQKNPPKGQSDGKVVVSVTLLRFSTYFETYENCMGHVLNRDLESKITDDICGMPTSTLVPNLDIEFTWEWDKVVTIDFWVDYGISGTRKDDCGWYQNHLQMLFSCNEDPDKQRATRACPDDEILSKTIDVVIERTDAHGQSNNSGTACSATPGIGLGSTALKAQFGKQSTSATTSKVKDVWSRSEKRLLDSGFRLDRKTDPRYVHNLCWEAQYPDSIEPARHWEEKKWNDVRGTGLYRNVPVAVRGTWVLHDKEEEEEKEEVRFQFEATKQLEKWTRPSVTEEGKLKQFLRPMIKTFGPEKGNVLDYPRESKLRQVGQKLTRELILDHNFLKLGSQGFNRLKRPPRYGIKDPVSKFSINPIEEVVSKLRKQKSFSWLPDVGASSSSSCQCSQGFMR